MAATGEAVVDNIQMQLGFGWFHAVIFIILGFIYSRGTWHVFGIMFLAGDPGHKCQLSASLVKNDSHYLPVSTYATELNTQTAEDVSGGARHRTVYPMASVTSEPFAGTPGFDKTSHVLQSFQGDTENTAILNWTVDSCAVSYNNQNGTLVTLPGECPYGWTYGPDYDATILSEWDLVCERNFLVELSITIFMAGSTVGAMLISPLADRFGRKRVMMVCLLGQVVVGCGVAFVSNYILFAILRFLVGMLNIVIGLTCYVLMTETFPACYRTTTSIAFQVFWALGIMTVSAFGYFVRNWRHLQLLLSLPSVLAVACYWLLPESLPWLMSQKRWREAEQMIQFIAKINKKNVSASDLVPRQCESDNSSAEMVTVQCVSSVPSDIDEELSETAGVQNKEDDNMLGEKPVIYKGSQSAVGLEAEQQSSSILDLFRSDKMRLYSLIMFFLFLVNSLGYFGISFSVPVLHGNPFLNLCIMGAVEIPANIISIIVGQRIGRRIPNAGFLLLCGVSNIVALFVPDTIVSLKLAFVMVGKFAITATYSTIYLYSAEIFPTVIRNHAMGISSVFENIGSIAAPLIVHGAKSIPQLPLVLFGMLTIVGAGLSLLLPETHSKPLPQTVSDITS